MGILLYTHVVRVFLELPGPVKFMGILLYTRVARVFLELRGAVYGMGILLYTRVERVFLEPKVLCKSWVYFYIPVRLCESF